MELSLECEREEDGRWLAEVPQLPGVLVYAATENEAMAQAEVLALRVLAEQIEQGEGRPQPIRFVVPAALARWPDLRRPARALAALLRFGSQVQYTIRIRLDLAARRLARPRSSPFTRQRRDRPRDALSNCETDLGLRPEDL